MVGGDWGEHRWRGERGRGRGRGRDGKGARERMCEHGWRGRRGRGSEGGKSGEVGRGGVGGEKEGGNTDQKRRLRVF